MNKKVTAKKYETGGTFLAWSLSIISFIFILEHISTFLSQKFKKRKTKFTDNIMHTYMMYHCQELIPSHVMLFTQKDKR